MWKLKDVDTRARFENEVTKHVIDNASDLWKSFKKALLKVCDEVCGWSNDRIDGGNTWWWNDEVKKVVRDKKVAFKEFCRNRSVDNKDRYTNTKNRAKKVISKAMKREAEVELEKL